MPIVKESSAKLVKEQVPYEIISREVIQSVTNPTALAIYCYLISLPSDWMVRRQQILDHFDGLGRDRYDQAMRDLKEMGLVWVAVTRDALGRLEHRSIVVETIPKDGKASGRKTHLEGKPTMRENPPLKDTDNKSLDIQIEITDTDTAKTAKKSCVDHDTVMTESCLEVEVEVDIKKICADVEQNALFVNFWKHYPNKKGKAQAEKVFNRISSNDQQLALDDTIARAKFDPDWTKENGKYIPMPATYLNGKRFEDEWRPVKKSNRHGVDYV